MKGPRLCFSSVANLWYAFGAGVRFSECCLATTVCHLPWTSSIFGMLNCEKIRTYFVQNLRQVKLHGVSFHHISALSPCCGMVYSGTEFTLSVMNIGSRVPGRRHPHRVMSLVIS
jgi:hypothetical protein